MWCTYMVEMMIQCLCVVSCHADIITLLCYDLCVCVCVCVLLLWLLLLKVKCVWSEELSYEDYIQCNRVAVVMSYRHHTR